MEVTMYLYKEYNDSSAYGEEYTKLCPTKKEGTDLLLARVSKAYDVTSLDELRKDPEFADDVLEDDYVSIGNDGGDISYYIVESHTVTLSDEQLKEAYREGEKLCLEEEMQEMLAQEPLSSEERAEIIRDAVSVFKNTTGACSEYAVARKNAVKQAVDLTRERFDKAWQERSRLYKGRLKAFHHVDLDGIRYTLLENYTGQPEIKAVRSDKYREYDLLNAWIRNKVGDPAEHRLALASMMVLIPARRMIPSDMVRFITSRYNDLFYVPNFGTVLVDGKPRHVYYIDEYHFGFVGMSAWHICEFAEIRELRGIQIAPQPVR